MNPFTMNERCRLVPFAKHVCSWNNIVVTTILPLDKIEQTVRCSGQPILFVLPISFEVFTNSFYVTIVSRISKKIRGIAFNHS